jgi:hypothetical protein
MPTPAAEPRWIRLSVAWSPTPRQTPVNISWTINGAVHQAPPATHSPWPTRDIALHDGETLVLLASQTTTGVLSAALCEIDEIVAHDLTRQPGNVKCVYDAANSEESLIRA